MATLPETANISGVLRPAQYRRRPLFLHFFDLHFLEERGISRLSQHIRSEASLALRISIVLGSEVYVPAASYYESPLARSLLNQFRGTDAEAAILLIGSGGTIWEFAEEKRPQYAAGSTQASIYSQVQDQPFPWRRRLRSASADISSSWVTSTETQDALDIARIKDPNLPKDILERWKTVPERLGRSAFVLDYVKPILFGTAQNAVADFRTSRLINRMYFSSFAQELGAGVFQDLRYLSDGTITPSGSPEDDINYFSLVEGMRHENILSLIRDVNPSSVRSIFFDQRFRAAFHSTQAIYNVISDHRLSVDTIVINALPKEKDAALAVFGKSASLTFGDDRYIYYKAEFKKVSGSLATIIVVHPSAMGKARAAAAARAALSHFAAKRLFVIGIAGACPRPTVPSNHVRLGDVVIATFVVEHDHIKLQEDEKIYRDHPQRTSHEVQQMASLLGISADVRLPEATQTRYREILDGALADVKSVRPSDATDLLCDKQGNTIAHPEDHARSMGIPRLHLGVIATGDTLLKNSAVRDSIRDRFEALAIDMETSAVRDVAWEMNIQFWAFRGAVDYCDGRKNDFWHVYASVAAAAAARLFLEQIPDSWQ
ncbi:MAG TPA: hypothetical protein VMF67_14005 [Rhizomicrobium sp.]|nr:hypothetical protein [Rhizomicrobium sp.]